MELFIVDVNEAVKYADIELYGKLPSSAGRFLVEHVSRSVYKIEDTEIQVKNKKPYFVNADLHFSISHSKDFAAVCFDNQPVGFDLEYKKERDFEALLKRYKVPAKDAKNIFYRFWCEYEAKLKLGLPHKSLSTFRLFDEYMCAVASPDERDIEKELKIFRLRLPAMELEEISCTEFFEPLNVKV